MSSNAKQRSSTTPTRISMQKLVEKFPDDFLSRVFLLLVQDEARHARNKRPQYPWILASISTRWRKICLGNPKLWSNILLSWYSKPTWRRRPVHVPRIKLQLHRSGNAPLFIHVSEINWLSEEDLSSWRAVLPHSGRWEELEFGYAEGEEEQLGELLGEGNGGFSNLRRISFDTGHPESESYSLPLPGYNATLTSLRSLTLKYVSSLYGLEDFPWQQLTHLALKPYGGLFTDLLETLSQCKSLTHLYLSLDYEYEGMSVEDIAGEAKKASVVIPNLRSLTFGEGKDYFLYNILPFLRLPSLRYMKTRSIEHHDEESGDSPYSLLSDFVERSSCVTKLDDALKTQTKDGLELHFNPQSGEKSSEDED